MPADGALRELARTRQLPLADAPITARVTLNIADDKRYPLGVPAAAIHRGRRSSHLPATN
jgi:hypothetical protein